uniref:F-box domain-containing protein n=1 Tax=Moniliophthora roreri TaxID=221103 RepID=A0A0W0FIC4_MONRR
MKRSKDAPLTWFLESYNNEHSLPIFKHLIDNCERWSDVSLFVDDTILEDPIFESVSGRIPILKRLELRGYDFPRDLNAFAVAPALSVVDCVLSLDPCDAILPWVQIRVLTLHYSYSRESLAILSRCPNLEQLELELIGGKEDFPRFITPKAQEPVEDTLEFVLEYLTLPCLSSITFGSSDSWKWKSWDERQQQIQQFLLRSQCNITSLRLEVPELDDQQAIDLLVLFPSLETLYLHDEEVTIPLFLRQLIANDGYSSDSSRFLPRLSNLTLVMYGANLDAECLCNAVVSRWNPATETGICSLRSVTIRVIGDVDVDCLEKLSALEKLGAPGRRITISFMPFGA